jgi:DNA polymerase (family 10)
VRATGSAEHWTALQTRARAAGLTFADGGPQRNGGFVTTEREEDVYRLLGLPFVAPELREGQNEIDAAAAGQLPRLIERGEVLGFLHCHTNYSDGTSTVREWADACRSAGYGYLGLTDHSKSAAYAGGLQDDDIARQHAEIDEVNRSCKEFRVLKGVEADILADGTLDYTPDVRASFDFVIASVHSRFGMDGPEMTARVLKALDDPHTAILGHPTGRLLLSRDPYPIDLDRVFAKAAERGVAIEINADPQRLDLDWRAVRDAVAQGVTMSIGADAHGVSAMGNMDIGIGIARKAWLTKEQVVNARPLDGFLEHVARRRGKR